MVSKIKYQILYFDVPTDHKVDQKENENTDKYLAFTLELEGTSDLRSSKTSLLLLEREEGSRNHLNHPNRSYLKRT